MMNAGHPANLRRGFSLVELLVAVALGMLLVIAMTYAYLSSKTAFSRQQQLSSIQQSVRVAFDYLSTDARMVGHMGCYSGQPTPSSCSSRFCNPLAASDLATNFAVGVEGYEYKNDAADQHTLSSNAPADVTETDKWEANVGGSINSIPVTTIAGTGSGLTPGSDVLVIRTTAGRPVRLSAGANPGTGQKTFTIESSSNAAELCADQSTTRVSGFCTGSYGLIASCSQARVFKVGTIAGASPSTITLANGASLGNDPLYKPASSEVFPMQTLVYYVKRSSSGKTTSLYRRVFDGNAADGIEQELIEGVENLQIRYGIDTLPAGNPDGAADLYVAAKGPNGNATDSVTDWSKVVAIRVALLIRSADPIEPGLTVRASSVVNGVTVTHPSSGPQYDRRVFTTTVALRNRIAYF